ncbi:hypothetical protein A0H81_03651 [Grifola frondosa]|uniref:Uncharacterized protein n=1 Tax=Grifola frondosa TaxID=5627 RepID=A0A1C7MJ94_GRIFR|nr:hypothetical protein A0H81_03651 [Grifola frondosa]
MEDTRSPDMQDAMVENDSTQERDIVGNGHAEFDFSFQPTPQPESRLHQAARGHDRLNSPNRNVEINNFAGTKRAHTPLGTIFRRVDSPHKRLRNDQQSPEGIEAILLDPPTQRFIRNERQHGEPGTQQPEINHTTTKGTTDESSEVLGDGVGILDNGEGSQYSFHDVVSNGRGFEEASSDGAESDEEAVSDILFVDEDEDMSGSISGRFDHQDSPLHPEMHLTRWMTRWPAAPTLMLRQVNPNRIVASDLGGMRQELRNLTDAFKDLAVVMTKNMAAPKRRGIPDEMIEEDDGYDVDADDPSPSTRKEKPRKLAGLAQRRDEDHLLLVREVQCHARLLMHREEWDSPFDEARIPTDAELQAFDKDKGRCCTADDFRPDVNHPPGTPWNKSVAKVFAQSFLSFGVYSCKDENMIVNAFKVHFKYLRKRWNDTKTSKEQLAKRQRLANRNERKRGLFHRRLAIVLDHDLLRHHEQMLRRLGVDA